MKRNSQHSSAQTSFLISGLLIVFFMILFAWGNASLRQSNVQEQIVAFREGNQREMQKNIHLKKQYQSLKSPRYDDKWAKIHRGLAQKGEKIIILETPPTPEGNGGYETRLLEREILLSRPNREQWKSVFFPE